MRRRQVPAYAAGNLEGGSREVLETGWCAGRIRGARRRGHGARSAKPEGIWQIDGYFGWKWWEKQFPEYTVAPDMKFVYLHSKDGQTAASTYEGAPSAKHWDSVSLVDLVIDLNREFRCVQEDDLVPDKSSLFTQDEKDAIAVLTFLASTHLGVEHASPHAWVESTLNLTTTRLASFPPFPKQRRRASGATPVTYASDSTVWGSDGRQARVRHHALILRLGNLAARGRRRKLRRRFVSSTENGRVGFHPPSADSSAVH